MVTGAAGEPGTYEVRAFVEPTNEDDCGASIRIDVDPDVDDVIIIDRRSGQTFTLLSSGQAPPLGLNGTWRMVAVDLGQPVDVGRITAQTPEITIEADESSGVISGNFGCNPRRVDVVFESDDTGTRIIGLPETLEGEEQLCAIPDSSSDQLVLTERTLLALLSGEPASLSLYGDELRIGTTETNVVLELIDG